ncbi:lipoyl synthase [Acetomicrobium hydrogeniformans]|uniref:Lipoyl synthase n=1 Tax=Acetomicrobium hydrogeniformans ATCC BAA-1850 TaxID=592015 RepID=A0A0T5X804_9BACT|nr:lipoyl synthase [Acetomicrobium hydrogeniformans]KRT34433.1 putative lipoyl synthase [Acetomicrobium hydrogeniformans ATCC BAA-1850]
MNQEFPEWLKIPAPDEESLRQMQDLIKGMTLHTVCEEALCPNVGECFKSRTATFLLMGDVCTRNCNFCAVRHGNPLPLDPDEPRHIAEACKALGLKYVVLTCVTRDDLADGGASHMALVVKEVKKLNPGARVELLTSDLAGNRDALKTLLEAPLEVLAHNVETVPSLYPAVRPQADYERSLAVIEMAKTIAPKVLTKSGIMVGLGETYEEVIEGPRQVFVGFLGTTPRCILKGNVCESAKNQTRYDICPLKKCIKALLFPF